MGWLFSVNDRVIYEHKYYVYQYTEDLYVNLLPIGYYTLLQAKLTVSNQVGKDWRKLGIKLIRGGVAIDRGWRLGVNSLKTNYRTTSGRNHIQLKLFYIPPEHQVNRKKRIAFRKSLREILGTKKRSEINKFLRKYYVVCMK